MSPNEPFSDTVPWPAPVALPDGKPVKTPTAFTAIPETTPCAAAPDGSVADAGPSRASSPDPAFQGIDTTMSAPALPEGGAPDACAHRLALIVPCYNEADALPHTLAELGAVLGEMIHAGLVSSGSYLLFIDDGSTDSTWTQIRQAAEASQGAAAGPAIHAIRLSRNQGHQTALLAGLSAATQCDATISIDADLQDDTAAIPAMVHAWRAGHEIVYGVRSSRDTDTPFKRVTASGFYRLMSAFGAKQVTDHADFRLLSARAVTALLQYPERNVYLRGMIPLLGFRATQVLYERRARVAGETKYPLRRMLTLAMDGITSMSVAPLRIISTLGLLISCLSCIAIIWALFVKIFGHPIQGWTSVTMAVFLMGGLNLLCLGVIGEYIAKIYMETKRRPRFHIAEIV